MYIMHGQLCSFSQLKGKCMEGEWWVEGWGLVNKPALHGGSVCVQYVRRNSKRLPDKGICRQQL